MKTTTVGWMAGLGVVAAVGVAAAAFTASNTVPESSAGQGSGATTGFTVTGVQYTTDLADGGSTPSSAKVTQVVFSITRDKAGAAAVQTANADVYMRLLSDSATDGTWAKCATVDGTATCALTTTESIEMSSVDDIDVAAYDI